MKTNQEVRVYFAHGQQGISSGVQHSGYHFPVTYRYHTVFFVMEFPVDNIPARSKIRSLVPHP